MTVLEAINSSVPAPVITLSLMARFVSRQEESYSAQVIAALRNQFGGHAVRVSDALESQAAAEAQKSVAPGTPTVPATTVGIGHTQAADAVMASHEAAESAAEQSSDASGVVKNIQGTAQGIYKGNTDGPTK